MSDCLQSGVTWAYNYRIECVTIASNNSVFYNKCDYHQRSSCIRKRTSNVSKDPERHADRLSRVFLCSQCSCSSQGGDQEQDPRDRENGQNVFRPQV